MTFSNVILRSSLVLSFAGLLAGSALSACDLPDKNLGDDPPAGTGGDVCEEGDVQMQDCNECVCMNGEWGCTEQDCGNSSNADSGGMTCDPDEEPAVECGECFCEDGEWLCTAIGCDPTDTDGGECVDGDTMMQDCNECFCEGGEWACTDMACPEHPALMICDGTEPNDPVFVSNASLAGDILTLSVEYSGGCAEHYFGSCWDGAFAESDPVQAWFDLNHEDNDDPCDGIDSQDITIDLTPMREAWITAYQMPNGTITVHVPDFGTIDYVF